MGPLLRQTKLLHIMTVAYVIDWGHLTRYSYACASLSFVAPVQAL